MTSSPSTSPDGCPEQRPALLSRRTLFHIAGAAGLLTATSFPDARRAYGAPAAATSADTLVVVSLRGGFDGLSAVAPIGETRYAELRPTIGTPASLAKKVDDTFGLHPAMKPLYRLWDKEKLAVVHAVGQEVVSRSHAVAATEMDRGAPTATIRSGWIDRMLREIEGQLDELGAVTGTHVGSATLPRSMSGREHKFALGRLRTTELGLATDPKALPHWQQAVATLHADAEPVIAQPLTSALRGVGGLQAVPGGLANVVPLAYPDGPLGEALHDVARLVKADVGLRVATVDVDGWDLHAGHGRAGRGRMHDLLLELSTALAAFAKELGPRLDDVTLVTLSEFGRRAAENGSGGTDHGHGTAVLVLGGGIRGGRVYGRWPGLAVEDLIDGDLAGTTDYRSILVEILSRRCGIRSTADVFPGFTPKPLGLAATRTKKAGKSNNGRGKGAQA